MSFFDMPSGYSDADLEMSALEERGRIAYKRTRAFTPEQLEQLRAGLIVESAKDTGEPYTVLVKTVDEDEFGPIFDYSVTGEAWYSNAKAARLGAA